MVRRKISYKKGEYTIPLGQMVKFGKYKVYSAGKFPKDKRKKRWKLDLGNKFSGFVRIGNIIREVTNKRYLILPTKIAKEVKKNKVKISYHKDLSSALKVILGTKRLKTDLLKGEQTAGKIINSTFTYISDTVSKRLIGEIMEKVIPKQKKEVSKKSKEKKKELPKFVKFSGIKERVMNSELLLTTTAQTMFGSEHVLEGAQKYFLEKYKTLLFDKLSEIEERLAEKWIEPLDDTLSKPYSISLYVKFNLIILSINKSYDGKVVIHRTFRKKNITVEDRVYDPNLTMKKLLFIIYSDFRLNPERYSSFITLPLIAFSYDDGEVLIDELRKEGETLAQRGAMDSGSIIELFIVSDVHIDSDYERKIHFDKSRKKIEEKEYLRRDYESYFKNSD